jgi:hypothetical protein
VDGHPFIQFVADIRRGRRYSKAVIVCAAVAWTVVLTFMLTVVVVAS